MVDIKLGDQRRRRGWRQYLSLLLAVVVLAVAACLWFLAFNVVEGLFSRNPYYTLRHLEIKTEGPALTPEIVKEFTGLAEGTNLFAFDIGQIREKVLQSAPSVKSMTIMRRLPDTLRIELTERMAVARIGRGPPLVIDLHGHVYYLRNGWRTLPVITGPCERGLRVGSQLEGLVLNAVEVIETCNATQFDCPIRVESIDLSNSEYLGLRLAGGERVSLNWEMMDQHSPEARQKLVAKLQQLSDSLKVAAGRSRRIGEIDLTYHAQYIVVKEN